MPDIVRMPYDYYANPAEGNPLSNGEIYIGKPGEDPTQEIHRLTVNIIQENGTIVPIPPASQPIDLNVGGTVTYNGSPARISVDETYSIAILDSSGAQIYYASSIAVANVGLPPVDTLQDLIDLPIPTDPAKVYVISRTASGDGYAGDFIFVFGNQVANVALDPRKGVWVAPASDPTGGTGAWKREYAGGVFANWFDGQDHISINAAIKFSAHVEIEGDYTNSGEIELQQRTRLTGSSKVATTINYTGTGKAFNNVTGGRIFDVTLQDFYVNNTGTGTDAFYLQDVVNGHFERVDSNGFERGWVLATSIAPQNNALYNRFLHCYVGNASVAAWDILQATSGTSTSGGNSTTIAWSRANVSAIAVRVANSNDVTIIGNQFESGTNGVVLTGSIAGVTNRTRITSNRFEGNSGTDINIGVNVAETILDGNYYVNTATRLIDNGTRTQDMDLFGQDWEWRLNSTLARPNGCFQFLGTANAAASEPLMSIRQTNSSAGTATALDVKVERPLAHTLILRNASQHLFRVNGQGHIGTNQGAININTPAGATAYQLPIYDDTGLLLGYIPIYGAAW